jgi:hypothetical protein
MALAEITRFYQNILGRQPDRTGIATYTAEAAAGRSLSDIRNDIYNSPEANRYRAEQQNQEFQNQISQLQSTYQRQVEQQQAQFAEAQRRQQERMAQIQQQALEAQTRQAAPQQAAQVLGVGKSLAIRRPGASTRFSRPELQIKSVNI